MRSTTTRRLLLAATFVLLFPLALLAPGCGDDDDLPRTAAMGWFFEDDCDDGHGVDYRLFDLDNGDVWPSEDTVYTIERGGSSDVTIGCVRGHMICYGARDDGPEDLFWGIDIDGNEDCNDCCFTCDDVDVDLIELTCSKAKPVSAKR